MQHAALSRTTSTAPIQSHPDYSTLMWEHDLEREVMEYDLEAARWVSGLLATIMTNAELLKA